MHNFKENSGSYIFSRVTVKQSAVAIVKYAVIVQEVELCKSVRIAARPLDKISIFVFSNGQGRLPLYTSFSSSSYHRNYKRMEGGKRPKKIRKHQKKMHPCSVLRLKTRKKGRAKPARPFCPYSGVYYFKIRIFTLSFLMHS